MSDGRSVPHWPRRVAAGAVLALGLSAAVAATGCTDDTPLGRPPEGQARIEAVFARCLGLQPREVSLDIEDGVLMGWEIVIQGDGELPDQPAIRRCLRAVNLGPPDNG